MIYKRGKVWWYEFVFNGERVPGQRRFAFVINKPIFDESGMTNLYVLGFCRLIPVRIYFLYQLDVRLGYIYAATDTSRSIDYSPGHLRTSLGKYRCSHFTQCTQQSVSSIVGVYFRTVAIGQTIFASGSG
jgi:hypothetical protein